MSKAVFRIFVVAAAAMTQAATGAEDDFPIAGTYVRDQACKGDGSDPADLLVNISRKTISTSMQACTVLNKSRTGRAFMVHVQCKMPGDLTILGDVTFTQRDDNALDFDDQDHTSPAVLYRCSK